MGVHHHKFGAGSRYWSDSKGRQKFLTNCKVEDMVFRKARLKAARRMEESRRLRSRSGLPPFVSDSGGTGDSTNNTSIATMVSSTVVALVEAIEASAHG